MSRIQHVYLDWSQPALPAAADWLLAQAGVAGDLSGMIVVVPASRAQRRLLEILVQSCSVQQVGLSPPQIVTVGALPELLYSPQRPFADLLTQRLAWVAALRQIGGREKEREALAAFIPDFPSVRDISRLLELADVLRGQHRELAADGLDFGDVARETSQLGQACESQRWTQLRKVQRKYLDVLDGLQLWDQQTARLEAIKREECATDQRLVLLGAVDMNRAMRQMLDQVASSVTALIIAPAEMQQGFDEHGCVQPAHWAEVVIPIDDARIVVADDPADQADEVARAIAQWDTSKAGDLSHGPKYRGDEITVGVCDERLVPQIERQLAQCGLPVRWGPGKTISTTAPFRLLRTVSDYLNHQTWYTFAALIRHSDLEAWLNQQPSVAEAGNGTCDWLTLLDRYQTRHVTIRLDGDWLGEADDMATVKAVYDCVASLLSDFEDKSCLLTDWSPKVVQFLRKVYGERIFHPEDPSDRIAFAALEEIHGEFMEQQRAVAELIPQVSAADSIRWALEAIAVETIPALPEPGAIELLGWLELSLDDAPALIVTSLNEGKVPKSSTSDMFLPDSLRSRLGLDDNARRYARDCYALSVILASRDAWIIIGRRDVDGYPLAPSRLLLAADDETLICRAKRFFKPPATTASKRPLAVSRATIRAQAAFHRPRPQPLKTPIESLRVTAFRDYLACPYRFYLRNVEHLSCVDDASDELDGGAFGDLAHEIFNRFGKDERRHTTSAEEIETLLQETLHTLAIERFGKQPRPAVAVQIEQLRRRLQTLAEMQAERAAAGWRIVYSEVPTEGTTCILDVDGQPFSLSGRIDRIDRHEATGAWAILDYKTGDNATKPEKTHRRQDEWIDLQLPLYRHLAAEVDAELKELLADDSPIELGYIQLPKSTDEACFEPAEWNTGDLEAADECARRVVRKLRQEIFWPPTDPPPDFSEDLAGICLDGVFGRDDFEDELQGDSTL